MLHSFTTHRKVEFYIPRRVREPKEILNIWLEWKAIDSLNGACLTQDFSFFWCSITGCIEQTFSVIIELVKVIMTFE